MTNRHMERAAVQTTQPRRGWECEGTADDINTAARVLSAEKEDRR